MQVIGNQQSLSIVISAYLCTNMLPVFLHCPHFNLQCLRYLPIGAIHELQYLLFSLSERLKERKFFFSPYSLKKSGKHERR